MGGTLVTNHDPNTVRYLHHIIPKHEWKERFGTLRGVNASDNLVWLSLEQHAEVHKWLWEYYGRWEDKIAFRALPGYIGKEEIISEVLRAPKSEIHKQRISKALSGRGSKPWVHTEKWQSQHSERMTGQGNPMYGSSGGFAGKRHSEETKKKISRKRTTETRLKQSIARKLWWEKRRALL